MIVRDVTLREFGQNVRASAADAFTLERRLWLARGLVAAGFRSIEVASTASPRVAPAMAVERLRPFLEALGRPGTTELITLVPGRAGFRRFLELGLGPEGLHHGMGVFVSAMDEHNLANLRCTVEETLADLAAFVPDAAARGTRVVGYVSAAFGFVPGKGEHRVRVGADRVAALVARLAGLGASSVTLSDLQGLAGPDETAAVLSEVIAGAAGTPLGYHAHHVSAEAALENVAAAAGVGVRIFDASLGAVGGCVTGAPGNAPTEGVVARLERLGLGTGLDLVEVTALARSASKRIYEPVAAAS
jgi:hydroxymethylglutaryl-CoA lyase